MSAAIATERVRAKLSRGPKRAGFSSERSALNDLHVCGLLFRAKSQLIGTKWLRQIVPSALSYGGKRSLKKFGDAVVLSVPSTWLSKRHEQFRTIGASWDHDEYRPHVSITWSVGDFDWEAVGPYAGRIELGPEIFEPVKEKWREVH